VGRLWLGDPTGSRPRHTPGAATARTTVHAVSQLRLPFQRHGRELDRHRGGIAVGVRLPDADRPCRSG